MAGEKCFQHTQDAAAQCKACEKHICKDCQEMYGAESGAYKGESLCYECVIGLGAESTANIAHLRKKVNMERIVAAVAAVILILVLTAVFRDMTGAGLNVWLGILIGIFLGGVVGMLPETISRFKSGDVGGGVICIFGAFFVMIKTRNDQLKQCIEIASGDSIVIEKMRNYLAYVQFMEKNEGVDLARLTAQGGRLSGNTYAADVLEKGEETACAELRQGVNQIIANNEITKKFGK